MSKIPATGSRGYQGSVGVPEYLGVYLAAKTVGGICEVRPLTQERVRQIAVACDYSLILEGKTGFGASIARQFLLPLLQQNLPELVHQKLQETTKAIKEPMLFPTKAFHSTLKEIISYYSELINAYRKTANEPILLKSVEKSVEENLEQSYASQGKDDASVYTLSIQKVFEMVLFKESLKKIPWPLRAPVSLLLYSTSFILGHLLPLFSFAFPKSADPLDKKLDIFMQIAVCRFLKDLKKAMNKSANSSMTIDKKLLERFLQQERLVYRLHSCSSQEQIKKVLNDNSTLRWVEDRFLYTHIAKEVETMIGISWSILKQSSWKEREFEHFLSSLNDFFENPDQLLREPHDIDTALQEFILDILDQKLPNFFDFAKPTIAEFAIAQKSALLEKRKAFWLKSYNFRFGLLHHQILNRWIGSSS